MNTLFYGDNLNILRRYIRDESVDLVYLDPPFNSNRNYNVLFKDESGLEADSREWFSADTWHWKGAASTYDDLIMIVASSSNEGDVVLDPFAGCGTTIAAAQKLNRQWIGIDITQLSIALLKNRLEGNFGMLPGRSVKRSADTPVRMSAKHEDVPAGGTDDRDKSVPAPVGVPFYRVIGEPEDLHDANKLATEDRYQFQYWALSLIQARPLGGQTDGRTGKKGSDKGIDGIKVFVDDNSGKAKRVIVQVKSGHVKSGDIRDRVGTLDREDGAIGVFITLEKATSYMNDEAASAGFFTSEHFGKFPRIQILTIEDLLAGKTVQMPPSLERTFKQAERIETETKDQGKFGFN